MQVRLGQKTIITVGYIWGGWVRLAGSLEGESPQGYLRAQNPC